MKKVSHPIEFKLFCKIMMLDRLLNDGTILQVTPVNTSELQARREAIAKLLFAPLTEDDKKIFLKSLSAVYNIIKKAI